MSVPPRGTYQPSNTFVKLGRRLLNIKLEGPVRLQFESPWEEGNGLFDWYNRRTSRLIEKIQLRKQREAPFFHEFVVFSLRANGGYFRIDRRQQPDEEVPLDAIYTCGVEAFDTIEEVTSFDGGLQIHSSSDCLMEVEFRPNVDVHLALLLKICQAICRHERSKVYTIQRYNCYFFAQTIMLCAVCAVSNWDGTYTLSSGSETQNNARRWKSPNSPEFSSLSPLDQSAQQGRKTQGQMSAPAWPSGTRFDYDWVRLSRLVLSVIQISPFLTHADDCTHCRESQSLHRQRSLSSEIDRLKESLTTYWNDVFRDLINQVRADALDEILKSGIWKVRVEDQSEIKCSDRVTEESHAMERRWQTYYQLELVGLSTGLRDLLEPTRACGAWDPHPDVWESTWASNVGAPFQRAVKKWEGEMTAYFDSSFSGLQRSLNKQAVKACSRAHQSAINARLESFEESMIIRHVEFEVAAMNLEDELKQSEKRKEQGQYPGADAMRPMPHKRFASIFPIRELLSKLIDTHSIRVQQYKLLLKCDAAVVDSDIRGTMNDIWDALVWR